MAGESIKITCKDCKAEFEFTAGEQQFYALNNFTQPLRCKPCRVAKKARVAARGAKNGNQ